MKKNIGILMLSMLFMTTTYAQQKTNKEALERISIEQETAWKKAEKRAKKYAKEHHIEKRVELKDGTIIELVDVVDGRPVYLKTDNLDAAITTHAYDLWENSNFGGGLTGAGFDKIAVWDGGRARLTHQEFNNTGTPRVTTGDNASVSDHATHVIGTILAGGVDSKAKGMAFEASLKSYDWNNVESEMATAASQGYVISNHSWGYITGWNYNDAGQWIWTGDAGATEDYRFGYYSSTARDWDNVCYNAPQFLIVTSAGNDRGDGPSEAGTGGNPEKDGGEDGFDCISGFGTSKNVLSIGATEKVLNYTGPASVKMSDFSGWGPVDDGRIKPDIVADGVSVYSASSDGDTKYSTKSGTSMSSPNTTGSLVLLHQYYQQVNSETMRSSTIKALAIHTAEECGPDEGPDYMYGWGLLNVEKGAIVIKEDALQNTIDELTLQNNVTYERTVTVSANEPLRVTICWIDPQGPVHSTTLNNRTPVLVNDLDLKITDESGNTYYPYKLDPDNPSAAATKNSTNDVDNVEHIYIEAPVAGQYKIIVTNKGTLQGGSQAFSLIVSGIDEYTDVPECAQLTYPENESETAIVNKDITWTKASFATGYNVYLGTDGDGTSLPTNIMNGISVNTNSVSVTLDPATRYYIAVQPKNAHGVNTTCGIYSFTTYSVEENELPYIENVDEAIVPEMPDGWRTIDNSEYAWVSTSMTGNSGRQSFVCMTMGQTGLMDNILVSPPIAVKSTNEYNLSFVYHGYSPSVSESLRVVWGTYPTTEDLTNQVFANGSINFNTWREASALIVPNYDGYIYIGFHMNTANGRGLFIDDIEIEDWGLVSLPESSIENTKIHYRDGKIYFNISEPQQQMEVSIFNALGQQILQIDLSNRTDATIDFVAETGVYIVRMKSNSENESRKIVVK
ncbi:MAG: S8 family serine peptidase [Lentimicrobiaceae bacterium]|jgi:hypothetical protein|nr:S8 family serine peptidase [Lentimicrobiaceae bacterium]